MLLSLSSLRERNYARRGARLRATRWLIRPNAVTQSPHSNGIALRNPRPNASGHASAPIRSRHCRVLVFGLGWGASGDCNMSSIGCTSISCVDARAGRTQLEAPFIPAARAGIFIRLLAVSLAAASLAACAQSSVVTQKSELRASRHASLDHDRTTSSMMKRRVAAVRRHIPVPRRDAAETKTPSHGVASYYTEGTKTASGE